jgi:hypothetical protein
MSLGKRHDVHDYLPMFKIDVRDGTLWRCDRVVDDVGNWSNSKTKVATEDFEAVFDLAGIQTGWMLLSAGTAPNFSKMVKPGEDIGEAPDGTFKEGFRLKFKLTNGAGDGVYELASPAVNLWKSVDELHTKFVEECGRHAGKLPIVAIDEFVRCGGRNGTYFRPIFKIVGWAKRPAELKS